MIGKKDNNYKEIFQNLQDCVLQYVVENYKKGVDLAPFMSKMEEVNLSIKEPITTMVTVSKDPT